MEKEFDHSKCLQKVRAEIMKDSPEVKSLFFDISNVASHKSKFKYTGQRFTYIEEYKKRDGSIGTREVKSFIGHIYCPFCGGKITK